MASPGQCGSSNSASSCLKRCDLPKHKCLERQEIKPGNVPKNMGWLYTAKDAPAHQLRVGWRPGHISCPVLKMIADHHYMKIGGLSSCSSSCARSPCGNPTCLR